jgi:hypothetical protein
MDCLFHSIITPYIRFVVLTLFLKIRGQDRAVYFSLVPSKDWLVGVDTQPSSPWHQASLEASEESLSILGRGDEDERMEHVHEKRKGKQLVNEELSPKRKKSTRKCQHEEGPVTISATALHRRQQMIVTISSKDDRIEARAASRVATLPAVVPGGTETRGMWRTWEVAMTTQPGTQAPTI